MLPELYIYGRDVSVVTLGNNKGNLHEHGILSGYLSNLVLHLIWWQE